MDGEMSGPRPPDVVLPPRHRGILERLARRATSTQRLIRRVQIILGAADGLNNEQLAHRLGLKRDTARTWRDRWLAAGPRLAMAEAEGVNEAALTRCILLEFDDEPRAGAPPTFSAEQICQIIALACEPPVTSGRPVTHWTPTDLADEAIKRRIVTSISTRTVARFLGSGRPQAAPLGVLAE
jgi:homeodomain-containing protein